MSGWIELGRFTPDEAEKIHHLAIQLGQMIDDGESWWSGDWKNWRPPDHMTAVDLPAGWDELTPL